MTRRRARLTDGTAAQPLHTSIHGDGAPPAPTDGGEGVWRRVPGALRRNPVAIAGASSSLAFVVVALLAPLLAPYEAARAARPGGQCGPTMIPGPSAPSTRSGLDRYGGDVLSKLIWGARASLLVGVLSTLFGLRRRCALGLLAGRFGGWVDFAAMRLVDLMLSVPSLLLAVSIAAIAGPVVDVGHHRHRCGADPDLRPPAAWLDARPARQDYVLAAPRWV